MSGFRVIAVCPFCLILLGLSTGCGSANRAAVTGDVTLDGQPVQDGTISFTRIGKEQRASDVAGGKIENGRYSIAGAGGPMVGSNRVEIRSSRKTGRKLPAYMDETLGADEYAEAIPERYNAKSELSVDVKRGQNTFDFKLQSKR